MKTCICNYVYSDVALREFLHEIAHLGEYEENLDASDLSDVRRRARELLKAQTIGSEEA